jgi:hypothetical protein
MLKKLFLSLLLLFIQQVANSQPATGNKDTAVAWQTVPIVDAHLKTD